MNKTNNRLQIATMIVLAIATLTAVDAHGKIVTMQGARYYQVGSNSFLVQPNGSIDEADAKAVVNILKRHYKEKNSKIAAEVYEDIHMVYKGQMLGEIYKYCFLSNVTYVITSINKFNKSDDLVLCRFTSRSHGMSTSWYDHLYVNSPFDIVVKHSGTHERGQLAGIGRLSFGHDVRAFTVASIDSYCKSMDKMLSKIYDNTSIRGCYGDVEIALVNKLIELNDWASKTRYPRDLVKPIYHVAWKYIKSTENKRTAVKGLRKNDISTEYLRRMKFFKTKEENKGVRK